MLVPSSAPRHTLAHVVSRQPAARRGAETRGGGSAAQVWVLGLPRRRRRAVSLALGGLSVCPCSKPSLAVAVNSLIPLTDLSVSSLPPNSRWVFLGL